MTETCAFVRADGMRCQIARGLSPDGFCWAHRPDRPKRKRKARSVVVPASSEVPDGPQSVEDAKAWLSWAARAVATGNMDAATGRDLSAVLRQFVVAAEKVDLAGAVAALRRQVEEMKGGAA